MPDGALAQRLGRYVDLRDGERAALAALETMHRPCARGTVIRRERSGPALWVLKSGWVATVLGLPDGGRQITRIHLAGDLLGGVLATTDTAMEAVTALTDAVVAPVPRAALTALFDDHPRLAALLYQLAQVERLSLGDRMAAIGRTDARARLAGLLLDMINRLRAVDGAVTHTLSLPLTQEEIGDATGLTAVHVNRMMRSLAECGLIARTGATIRLMDEAGLVRMSGYVNRWEAIDTDWLPDPR